MRIFDSDGAPYSYEHLGRLAPEPPPEWEFNGHVHAVWEVRDFATTATDDKELRDDLRAYFAKDADSLDFDMEEE